MEVGWLKDLYRLAGFSRSDPMPPSNLDKRLGLLSRLDENGMPLPRWFDLAERRGRRGIDAGYFP
eukprot:5314055-Alexandrium_andersonii.AAC.1